MKTTPRQHQFGAGNGVPAARPAHESPIRRPRTGTCRAFTMIEIMVVVAIMGLVLAMGIPAIYAGLHRGPMAQAVTDVLDACKAARSLAIMQGKPVALNFYPAEKRLSVGESGSDAKTEAGLGAGARETRVTRGFSAQISDHLIIEMLDVNYKDCRKWDVATVMFDVNGP